MTIFNCQQSGENTTVWSVVGIAMQLLRVLFGHQVNVSALLMTRSAISRTKTANGSVVHFRSQENTKIPVFSITFGQNCPGG